MAVKASVAASPTNAATGSRRLPLGKIPSKLLKELLGSIPKRDHGMVIGPGIGRDAAGITIGNRLVGVTTDPITFSTQHLAIYSLAVNINDLVCLGCRPTWYTANFLLPPNTTEQALRELWQDTLTELEKHQIQAIGGHTEVTEAVNTPVIVGQLMGEAISNVLLNPTNGSPGDIILLWQSPGIEGSALLATERYEPLRRYMHSSRLQKMQRFIHKPGLCVWPFVKQLLPCQGLVALHDPTEGGLATAIHELADAANCGVTLFQQQIPLREEVEELCNIYDINPLGLMSSGCLLMLCRPQTAETILETFKHEPISQIGELTRHKRRIIKTARQTSTLPRFHSDEAIRALQTGL